MSSTLFERIGGDAAVDAAVDKFYLRVLADERIQDMFEGVDMRRLASHQKDFLKFAFGGIPEYSGRTMNAAHARLVQNRGLSDVHFDAVLEDLAGALKDLNVAEDMIAEVIAIAETTRADVLGRKERTA